MVFTLVSLLSEHVGGSTSGSCAESLEQYFMMAYLISGPYMIMIDDITADACDSRLASPVHDSKKNEDPVMPRYYY